MKRIQAWAVFTIAASLPGAAFASGTVGVRTATELYETLAAVTGLDPATPALLNYYMGLRSRLSKTGKVEDVNPSLLLTSTSLSAVFCDAFLTAESRLAAGSRRAHAAVDFSRDQTSLNNNVRTAVFGKYAELFWQRELTAVEMQILSTEVDESIKGKAAAVAETRNALMVACTSALSSLDVLRN